MMDARREDEKGKEKGRGVMRSRSSPVIQGKDGLGERSLEKQLVLGILSVQL